MFSDWTDPHDIDNYYNDIHGMFRNVQDAPSSSAYIQHPVRQSVVSTPEPPTGVIINSPTGGATNEMPKTETTQPISKNSFEVQPNTIFSDGHPVGQQPTYNILQSGPMSTTPEQLHLLKESYWNKPHVRFDWVHIITFFMVVLLSGLLAQAYSQVSNTNNMVQYLASVVSSRSHYPIQYHSA